MSQGESSAGAPSALEPQAAFATNAQMALLCAGSAVVYLALASVGSGLPGSVPIAVPFLALPLAAMLLLRAPLRLGRLDRTFVFSAAAYAPFALFAAAAVNGNPWFFVPLAANVAAPAGIAFWALDTFFHVGAVDFFTKRVVQSEAEARFGRQRALVIQVAVWSGAHVIEWGWLRLLFGDLGAAVYLVAAGVVTGFAYMRWRNVLGLMVGHFLVNVAAALAAVAVYG